jgi:RsiW-degrading membrane proteinase PrsW (M82 family)
MTTAMYFAFAVAPVLIIIGLVILRVTFKVKNWVNIRNAILLGMISSLLVLLANFMADMRWQGAITNLKRITVFVFVIVAFSAEFGKYLALRLAFYKLKTFEGPIEGIIYSNFISLGYATVAVVLFGFGLIETPRLKEFELFLILYPIANVIFSTCMGFFLGMGKLRKNTLIDNATGIFVATFFHGLFYFSFVTSDLRLQLFVGIGFILIAVILFSRAVRLRKNKEN